LGQGAHCWTLPQPLPCSSKKQLCCERLLFLQAAELLLLGQCSWRWLCCAVAVAAAPGTS
jgi:hypothetical protein